MVDAEWLKHLAGASFDGGRWTPLDPDGVRRLAAARVDDAITVLQDLASEACEIHNGHARGKRSINYLAIVAKPPLTLGGFMLLLGRTQVSLEYRPHTLCASLTVVRGFERMTKELHRFVPHADPFGSIAWSMDNTLLMTTELIIKRLFEDLTRAAFEAGDTKNEP